jgi:hypothetical protein
MQDTLLSERMAEEIQAKAFATAKKMHDAYKALREGMARFREEGVFLAQKDLALIRPVTHHLVLSDPEARLLAESRLALRRKRERMGLGLFSGVLLLSLAALLFQTVREKAPASSLTAIETRQEVVKKEKTAVKTAKPLAKPIAPPLNTPTSANAAPVNNVTSNLPLKQIRRDMARAEAAPSNPTIVEATPEPAVSPSTPDARQERVTLAQSAPVVTPAPKKASNVEKIAEATRTQPVVKPEVEEGNVEGTASNRAIRAAAGRHVLIEKDGLWGMVDQRGSITLEPAYDAIEVYHEKKGLVLLKKGGKVGVAEVSGKILLHPFFDRVGEYYAEEGYLVVGNDGKVGVYNQKALDFLLSLQYGDICCYAEELFGVKAPNGKWGFVDQRGKYVIAPVYDGIEKSFRSGLAKVRQSGRSFFIDSEGQMVDALP